MPTQTIENYLKAIFHHADEVDEVGTTDIAKSMQVSLPTVNNMAKKLSEKGFVEYRKYKPLKITSKGKKEAALIIRKHRLTEMFLVEKMGFKWHEVHEVAEQVEHIHSPLFFEKMDELLGKPKFDPHGSPIPDKNGNIKILKMQKLSQGEIGKPYILSSLGNTSDDFLKYLDSRGIFLGIKIRILEKDNFADSLLVAYPGHSGEVLTETVCKHLLVESKA